jgi:antirestriction protein ArdC
MTAATAKRNKRNTPQVPMEEKIAAQLIAAMESGDMKWRRPWDQSSGHQQNLISGHRYTGSNQILTEVLAACQAWPNFWITFNGARSNGMTIQKGSKAVYILKPLPIRVEVESKESGDPEVVAFTRFTVTPVFNIAQLTPCEKLDELVASRSNTSEVRSEPDRLAAAEALLGDWPVQPSFHGDKAFYVPSTDKITLPGRKQFHSAAALYSTWAHEVIHSTGHQKRLDRDMDGQFGSPAYAKEELVAELGSVLLCSRMEIGYEIEAHASYLQHWTKILKEEPKFVMKALSQARRAADLVVPPAEES